MNVHNLQHLELTRSVQIRSEPKIEEKNETKKSEKPKPTDVIELVANAIVINTLTAPITVPKVVKEFYIIDLSQKWKMKRNDNPTFLDLQRQHVFSGGFFVHDMCGAGFCIHQKLAPLRHALIRKYLKLESVTEYLPEVIDSKGQEVDAWKARVIDLRHVKVGNIQLLTRSKGFDTANLYIVFKEALHILSSRQWIDKVQALALELQYQVRSPAGLKQFYPKGNQYRRFLQNGIPMVEDLTAQSLYWECCRLLCLNEKNLMPPIHKLFDGPLFHFFCHLQHNGDSTGYIKDIMSELKMVKSGNRGRGRGSRRGNRGGRGQLKKKGAGYGSRGRGYH